MSSALGIDVGGTFTDVFVLDDDGGFRVAKVPSTRGAEADGFMSGVTTGEPDLRRLGAIVHGTTVGTNALLERTGAPAGLITTQGFSDVLEMRRRDRPRTWGLWGTFTPVISRDVRLGVPERTLADGTIETPVDLDAVRAAVDTLIDAGCPSVCVSFLNGYANEANEAAAAAVIRERWPNTHVTVATEILPEIREFERTSTAALNAYLQPLVADYLADLELRLADAGFGGRFLVVQSNGGIMTGEAARALPVRTALSGPAAGVIAAAQLAGAAGFDDVLTCDMGGTSFDIAVIHGGRSVLSAQTAVDFGMVIRTPMIEITTIGAGGGSIAHVDRGGVLQVGPESAGSIPGPACYGQGTTRPTVTDANVVLGRINADSPIGGVLERLDVAAAERAVDEHIGRPLGLATHAAAEAILKVATAAMSGALRLVSIERGHDPAGFVAMPFGGAGALHSCAFLTDLGLGGVLVPRYPGVTSALGCLVADLRHDVVRTINATVTDLDAEAMTSHLERDDRVARELVEESGVRVLSVDVLHELDMSYVGQTHTVTVPFDPAGGIDTAAIVAAFEATYRETYGRVLEGIAIRLLSIRTAAIGRRPPFDPASLAPPPGGTIEAAHTGRRSVWFEGEAHDTTIYQRLDLPVGTTIDGPAILEQPDATTVVEPGFRATVDPLGNVIIRHGFG